MTISSFQWYPTQINGHKYRGRNADFFQLPDTLLAVPAVLTADCGNLSQIQLTEFRTEHWFLTNDTSIALNGKVGKLICFYFMYCKEQRKCIKCLFFFN